MEHSTEKTELPKRRVFHEHIILLIEGPLRRRLSGVRHAPRENRHCGVL